MATIWEDLKLAGDALTDKIGFTTNAAATEYAQEVQDAGGTDDQVQTALQGAIDAEAGGAIDTAAKQTLDQVGNALPKIPSFNSLLVFVGLGVAALALWYLGPFIKKELPK